MTSNLPERQLFSTLPAPDADGLRMSPAELTDRVTLLAQAGTFGTTERIQWQRAAVTGEWTAEELLDAVDWLNVHHNGFVKIAHVHERIKQQRSLLRIARMYCWQHPLALDHLNRSHPNLELTERGVMHHWQDYRQEWVQPGGIADQVMAQQSAAEWKRWAAANSKNFRSEL